MSPPRAAVLGIGTAVPDTRLSQNDLRDLFAAQPGVDRLTARLIRAAFDHSAIDGRHTVLSELARGADATDAAPSPFIGAQRHLRHPPTGARNAVYVREAPALFAAAARAALDRSGVAATDITHVVTASCTGFFAPGPDFRLIRDLGLRTSVARSHLGFLGCAAALPALRTAADICAAAPAAHVLVVCGELCSIHLRASTDPDQIVSSAVFADGAAAAVVSAAPHGEGRRLQLDRFTTAITDDGESAMGWTIGDHGFEMTLTADVPRIVGREVRAALAPLLDTSSDHDLADAALQWAVHPGGRSILDRVEEACGLDSATLDHSRGILREYGNMSSATILFILERLLADPGIDDGTPLIAVAFAPGLTVEAARMTVRTAPADTPA